MAGRVQRSERREPGGIRGLVDLIDEHRGAFEYDWRTRFGQPLSVIGRRMTYGEAIRLTEQLASDPSSHVAAALLGWAHPYSREALALSDLFDLQHQRAWATGGGKGQRPKPYPRPWPDQQSKRTSKPDPGITQDDILAALRRAGHTAALPS